MHHNTNDLNNLNEVKQIFTQEIKDKLKDMTYAYLIDQDTYVIKVNDTTLIYTRDLPETTNQLNQLRQNYVKALNHILTHATHTYSMDYSDTTDPGFTMYGNNTVLVSYTNILNKDTIALPHDTVQIIDTTPQDPMFNKDTNIYTIVFNEHLTHIGANTFNGLSNVSQIFLRQNVTHIGASAFKDMTNLNKAMLSHVITHIGAQAFENTIIEKIILPHTVTHIGTRAFTTPELIVELNTRYNEENTIDSKAFGTMRPGLTIFVNDEDVEQYKTLFQDTQYNCVKSQSTNVMGGVPNV